MIFSESDVNTLLEVDREGLIFRIAKRYYEVNIEFPYPADLSKKLIAKQSGFVDFICQRKDYLDSFIWY